MCPIDVSGDVIDAHYDERTADEKAEQRWRFLPDD
jgi:hypothetical protein